MDLSQVSDGEILNRLEKLAHTERKITHLVLRHINEVRLRRLYADLGYSSMHRYLVDRLGYADDSAYRRDQAARVLMQIPQVAENLENGSLNLTQLTQVQKCLRQEKKSGGSMPVEKTIQVLQNLENKNNYESQKVLAVEFNQPIQTHEVLKPQRDNSARLEMMFCEEQLKILQQAKDLLSHVLPEATWSDLFFHLAQERVQKVRGKEKAEKRVMPSSTQNFTGARKSRKSIGIKIKRMLLEKAQHRCQHRNEKTGQRCESAYQLQVDHRIPLSCGGAEEFENYRILCRTHNLSEARKWGIYREVRQASKGHD